ncbi:hypothetical protein KY360_05360 [Candidatus Woesearchaeota archaeon]|nr:hypothetical protein [Candidatus Woesearchaeota archaeon]
MTKGYWLRRTVFVLIALLMFAGLVKLGLSTIVKSSRPDVDFNLVVDKDSSLMLKFEREVRLKSLRVSGSIAGNGTARIYVENDGKKYLVLDSERLDEANSLDISDLEFNDGENIVGAAVNELPKKDEDSKESFDLYASPTINEALDSSDLNSAYDRSGHIIEEMDSKSKGFAEDAEASMQPSCSIEESAGDVSKSVDSSESAVLFKEACIETCSLQGFGKHSYRMVFEVDNAVINIDKIEYAFRRIWEKEEIRPELDVRDSDGKTITSSIKIKDKDGMVVSEESIEKGLYDVDVELYAGPVKSIKIENIDLDESVTDFVNVDDVPKEKEGRFVEVYAIDPTDVEFTQATVTVTAKGSSLYKCKGWNFTEQRCYGEWELFKADLIPGKEYSFILTPEDPGFAEINIIDAEHLDKNRDFISNIFNETNEQDNIWSEQINHREYIRATFEEPLTNGNVINLYLRNTQGLNTFVEIYEQDGSVVVGSTPVIGSTGMYNIELAGLSGYNDIFDLNVVNQQNTPSAYLEFDYIHDAADNVSPVISGLNINPSLEISFFGSYNFTVNVTDNNTIDLVNLSYKGINAEGGSCFQYYVNGSCENDEYYTTNMTLGDAPEYYKRDVRPDMIYPQIEFADDEIYWYNSRKGLDIYKDKYHIFKFVNNYTINANTSFWIEVDALVKSQTTRGLRVYLFDRTTTITDFQSDWTNSAKGELVAEIDNNAAKNHAHTDDNSSHHLIALTANSDGTIGTKNLNLTDSFFIALYNLEGNVNKAWNMSYRNTSLCNTSNWWLGEDSGWTTTQQEGCPDTHVHLARYNLSGSSDGVSATSCAEDNSSNSNCTTISSFFGAISNLAPVSNAINVPEPSGVYKCPINISWNEFSDPNGDTVTYNVSLLNADETFNQIINDSESSTYYVWSCGSIPDGEYSLKVEGRDPDNLSSYSTLGGNFSIDNTPPAWSNNNTYPASGIQYASGVDYQFNITWIDARAGVDAVLFEHNFTGTLNNYSSSGNISNEHYYNSTNLSAGTYVWRSYANDTLGFTNYTEQWTYIVQPDSTAPSVINVTATPSSINQTQTTNITANITDSGGLSENDILARIVNSNSDINEYNMNQDGDIWYYEFTTTSSHPGGVYNITIRARDTNNNWNESEGTTLTVNDITTPSVTNVQPDNAVRDFGSVVEITANVTDETAISAVRANVSWSGVYSFVDMHLQEDNVTYSGNFSLTNYIDTFTVQILANDTSNNLNNSETSTFNVTDESAPGYYNITAWPSSAAYSPGAAYQFNVTWTDNYAVDVVLIEHNFTGSLQNYSMNNISSEYYYNYTNLAVGSYVWRSYANDTSDNRNKTTQQSYTVDKVNSTCSLVFSQTSPQDYGTAINASCSCTNLEVSAVLYRNGTDASSENNQLVILAVGDHLYNCTTSATQNYTSAQNSSTYTINKVTSTVNLTLNGYDSNITINQTQSVTINATLVTPSSGYIELYQDSGLINSGQSPLTNTTTYNDYGTFNITVTYSETQNYSSSFETHFISVQDVISPGSVTNLEETAVGYTWIYWNWTNPGDTDFDEAIVYIDGVNEVNTSNSYYNATGLTSNTNHTISIRTKDTSGNINTTWVNDTAATLADTTVPQITSYAVTPRVVIIDRDVSITANATDDVDTPSTYANITLPNSTVLTLALQSNYTAQISGRHNVTIIANDSSGNTATETDYFIAAGPVNFTVFSEGPNSSSLEMNLTLFFPGTDEELNEHVITGNMSNEYAGYLYDLEFAALNRTIVVELGSSNLTTNNNKTMGFDKLPSPVSGYLISYGIYSTFSFGSAVVTLSYEGINYTTESNLRVFRCDNWDFDNRACSSSFESISGVQSTSANKFTLTVSSFSGFSIREVTPAAAAEEEEEGEEVWRRSRGCFFSWECGNWSECSINETERRDCTNAGTCPDTFKAPETERPCNYTPSCDDGVKNGDEEGIDCGGSCAECVECINDTDCEEDYQCMENVCVAPQPAPEEPMPEPDVTQIDGYVLLLALLVFILTVYLIFSSIKWYATKYMMEEEKGEGAEKAAKPKKRMRILRHRKKIEPKETIKKEIKEKTEESKKERPKTEEKKEEEKKKEEQPKTEEKKETAPAPEKEKTPKTPAKKKKEKVIGGLKETYTNSGDIYVNAFRKRQEENELAKEDEETEPIKGIRTNKEDVLNQLKDAYKLDSLGPKSSIRIEPRQSLQDIIKEKTDEDESKNNEVFK